VDTIVPPVAEIVAVVCRLAGGKILNGCVEASEEELVDPMDHFFAR
jgi:hypothetical protein